MTYEDALANCIDLIEQGKPVDACLAQYHEHAVELEPVLRMVTAMVSLDRPRLSTPAFERGRAAITTQLLASNRARHEPAAAVLATAARPVLPRRPVRNLNRRHTLPKPYTVLHAMTSAVAVAVLLLSLYSVARSVNTSLPGDTFYAAKRASEEVQGALMTVIGESAAWHASQVERRIEESIALRNHGVHVAADLSTDMEEDVQRAITASAGLPVAERQVLLQEWLISLRQLQIQTTSHGQYDVDDDPIATTVQQTIDAVENAAGVYPIPAVEPSPTPTATSTPIPTTTPTSTATTEPPTSTATSTDVATATPSPTTTPTVVSVAPPVATAELLPTSTPLPTETPLPPPTETPTRRSSSSSKPDRKTSTPTPAPPTDTPVPPTPIPSPEVSDEPTAASSPDATSAPTDTPDPDATGTPSETEAPTAQATEGTPDPNETPDPEQTPDPTDEATDTPEPDNTSEPTSETTAEPTSEATQDATDVPETENSPVPDGTPAPTSEATSEPAPTVPPASERAAPTEAPTVDVEEPAPAITVEPPDTPFPTDAAATPEDDDP